MPLQFGFRLAATVDLRVIAIVRLASLSYITSTVSTRTRIEPDMVSSASSRLLERQSALHAVSTRAMRRSASRMCSASQRVRN